MTDHKIPEISDSTKTEGTGTFSLEKGLLKIKKSLRPSRSVAPNRSWRPNQMVPQVPTMKVNVGNKNSPK